MYVEAGAGFCRVIAVAVYRCPRKFLFKAANQLAQGCPLLRRSRVLSFAVYVQPADIAHTYTVGVPARYVCAYLLHWSAGVYAAVSVDYKVVAYAPPALSLVPAVNIGHGVVASLLGRATVYDNVVYLSHSVQMLETVSGFAVWALGFNAAVLL